MQDPNDRIMIFVDGDFVHCVEKIKSLGKQIEVATFKNAVSDDLRLKADKFIILDDFADQIERLERSGFL